ncbi:MAG: S8 family serine peptidase [Muribaculaceae bacterium]|nr:S8 family serine peptidase [Muribaculaceae bacterium]
MKKFLCGLVLVALTIPTVMAQLSKVDLRGQVMYENYKEIEKAKKAGLPVPAHLKKMEIPESITLTIRMGSEADIAKVEALGAEVIDVTGNMAIVTIKMSQLEELSLINEVKAIQSPRKFKLLNDKARIASRVNEIRAGLKDKSGNPYPGTFDGTGVLVGLMDTGLDPNHINFMDADDNTRVKGITKYSNSYGTVKYTNYLTPEKIANFTTEDATETHGTHVLGIIAGGYKDSTNDYTGMAPNADIYVCCGDLDDACILAAVKRIADFGKNNGNQPVVINLSLGGNSGSHDQYDSFNQYIDNLVASYQNPPIICISSGNEGDTKIAIRKQLTASSKSFATIVPIYSSYYWDYNASYGYNIEFYGQDGTPFSVTPFIYNYSQKSEILELTPLKVTGSGKSASISATSFPDMENYVQSGSLSVQSKVDSQSGRYSVVYHGTLEAASSTYRLGFRIEGSAGQTLYCYATDYDGVVEFTNGGSSSNYTAGSGDGSINSMCCGLNTLSIGSYNTKNQWTATSGRTYSMSSSFPLNRISYFSSWGNVWDGRLLPHVCAPGARIASSVSTYNVNYSGSYASYYRFDSTDLVAQVSGSSRDYHWGMLQGTSMSSPHATGVFALWKQLKQDMTPQEVAETAQATAKTDSYTTSAGQQSGAGKLDAYAGMQYIIEHYSGVESLISRNLPTVLVRESSRNIFEIAAAEGDAFTATLYGISGQVAAKVSGEGHATLSAEGLTKGVYVLKVNGAKVNSSQKLIVR